MLRLQVDGVDAVENRRTPLEESSRLEPAALYDQMSRPPPRSDEVLLDRARGMRRAPTRTEGLLWHRLRHSRAAGIVFRRQVPLGAFIVDFLAASVRLVVEVDGASHDHEEALEADERRDAALRAAGYEVLRFSDEQVLADLDGVVAAILAAAGRRQSVR